MNIETKFGINSQVYWIRVERETEERPCPTCGGRGEIHATGEDGAAYKLPCPKKQSFKADDPFRCRYGRITLGVRHVAQPVRQMTVGSVRVEIGGLSLNTNMGGPCDQTREREERVMCYETGVGSGSLYDVEPKMPLRGGRYWSGIFPTEEEATGYAEHVVRYLDHALALELAHAEAAKADAEREYELADALGRAEG